MITENPKLGKSLILGFGAAEFFSVSFVLNRQMARADGHLAWSSSLRFLMMISLGLVFPGFLMHALPARKRIKAC